MLAQVNGIQLYYETAGEGEAIVFIHGLGENSSSWQRQMEAFQKTHRVIAMDLRGHGQSEDNDAVITMELFAQDVLGLMDILHIDQAHFVGHSMGGLISQEIAAHNLSRILTMTLSDSAGFYPPPMGTTGLETRLHNIDTLPMAQMAATIATVACRPDVPESVKADIEAMFAQNRKKSYREATIATLQADYRHEHHKMTVPVLLLVGEFDQTTPLSYAQFLLEALPNATLKVISQAAHMTKMENPTEYNALLSEFLQGGK
ncbi:MAG: alpha/beta hydrolase [Sporomusaceae bacterium]|nr:alpha/beta hydrolase [Sporomusaceae bacterium]